MNEVPLATSDDFCLDPRAPNAAQLWLQMTPAVEKRIRTKSRGYRSKETYEGMCVDRGITSRRTNP